MPAAAIVLDAGGRHHLRERREHDADPPRPRTGPRPRGQPVYHLPRIKLAYAAAGVDVWTVPARTLDPQTKAIIAREIPAFWLYYLRAVVA